MISILYKSRLLLHKWQYPYSPGKIFCLQVQIYTQIIGAEIVKICMFTMDGPLNVENTKKHN